MRTVYLYVCDTMADWEPGYAIAVINRSTQLRAASDLRVRTAGPTAEPVTTMGGASSGIRCSFRTPPVGAILHPPAKRVNKGTTF